jgi:hypothetical protein
LYRVCNSAISFETSALGSNFDFSVIEPLTCATSFSQVSLAFKRSSNAAASDEEPLPTCFNRRSCFFNSFAVAGSAGPVVIAGLRVSEFWSVRVTGRAFEFVGTARD